MLVYDDIQQAGADARADGLPKSDNPYPLLDPLPIYSKDMLEQWKARHDAWAIGWMMEDAVRGIGPVDEHT